MVKRSIGMWMVVLVVSMCGAAAGESEAMLAQMTPEQRHAFAEKGEPSVQLDLGFMYDNGRYGVEQDFEQAVFWYRKAAERGHPVAQFILGTKYMAGTGVGQDLVQAAQWLEKAGEQGVVEAQGILVSMYLNGTGVPRDHAQAMKWLDKIKDRAEQGEIAASQMLGNIYFNGTGVLQDFTEALRWYIKAAAQGHTEMKELLKTVREDEEFLEALFYRDDPELFREYIEVSGVDINSELLEDGGPGFAHLAIHYNALKVLKEICKQKGVDLDAMWSGIGKRDWETPLGFATGNRNIEAMRILLENGANPDGARRSHPSLLAVTMGFDEGVRLILEYQDR